MGSQGHWAHHALGVPREGQRLSSGASSAQCWGLDVGWAHSASMASHRCRSCGRKTASLKASAVCQSPLSVFDLDYEVIEPHLANPHLVRQKSTMEVVSTRIHSGTNDHRQPLPMTQWFLHARHLPLADVRAIVSNEADKIGRSNPKTVVKMLAHLAIHSLTETTHVLGRSDR